MATRRVNLNSVNNENDTQKLIFSEWDPIFLFDAPWIKSKVYKAFKNIIRYT